MQKIVLIVLVVSVFTACKSQEEQSASTAVETIADSMQTPEPPATAGKLAATATDEVEGKEGKIISFIYDNNASSVSFELDGKQVVLTSKEKISDMPAANGRTYSNEEFTYNNKDGIKLTDKKGKLIFEEKQ
ncbi:MAG: hypothetical protein IPP60_13125 [Sphingobacteriales bacterium]|nr:hypothetical protein [Sphingobacteriales bacterium]